MSIFLNSVPLQLNVRLFSSFSQSLMLDQFFRAKWLAVYRVGLSLLTKFERQILGHRDLNGIIGQIKQAKEGCEYLMPNQSDPLFSDGSTKSFKGVSMQVARVSS